MSLQRLESLLQESGKTDGESLLLDSGKTDGESPLRDGLEYKTKALMQHAGPDSVLT